MASTPKPSRGPEDRTLNYNESMLDGPEELDHMERFARAFESAAKRWELVVYPSLFAFILLAAYGFFLIYSLASDVSLLARSMDREMGEHMASLSNNLKNLTINMDHMSANLADVATSMDTMTMDVNRMAVRMEKIAQDLDVMEPMLEEIVALNQNIGSMTQSVKFMTSSMSGMQRDMGVMNSNISRPMSFMNSFTPW